jgi:adenine-specific DNA-methyltransferase
LNLIPLSKDRAASFKNLDDDPRGPWASVDITGQTGHATPSQYYDIVTPSGKKYKPPEGRCWAISEITFKRLVDENRIWFGKNADSRPRVKQFLSETAGMTTWTWWTNTDVGHNQEATKELIDVLGQAAVFDNPKPVRLVSRMLQLSTALESKDIILDFFAGAGTTAHAVLLQNRKDGGNRKFILVQLPEPTGRDDYPTITDICKERVRRVIKKLNDEDKGKLDLNDTSKQDRGFRVFKLAESNFMPWNAEVPHDAPALERQLEMHVDHIREGRTADDILYEILLKSGFPLATPVETITLAGLTVHSVAGGALFICLERVLTLELIRAMADKKPERVVCLDEGFAGNDQLKANAVQIFKTNGVTSFKTV